MKTIACFIVLLAMFASFAFAQQPTTSSSATSPTAQQPAATPTSAPVVTPPAQPATPVVTTTPMVVVKTVSFADSVKMACDSLNTPDLAVLTNVWEPRLSAEDRALIVSRFTKDLNESATVDSFTNVYQTIWGNAPTAVSVQTLKRALPRRSTTQLRVLAERMTDPENLRPVERLIYTREMSLRDARIETLTQAVMTLVSPLDSTLTTAEVLRNPRDTRTRVLGAAAHQAVHMQNLTGLTMANSEAVGEVNGAVNTLAAVVQEGFQASRQRDNELTTVTDDLSKLVEAHFADRRGIFRRHHDGNALAKVKGLRERLIASAR